MKMNLFEIAVVIAAIALVGAFTYKGYLEASYKASCKHGRYVPTGATVCQGSESYLRCTPETRFVCDD